MALGTGARSSTAKGWSLREERGQVRLEMHQPDRPSASVLLPCGGSRQGVGAILARVRNIYVLTLCQKRPVRGRPDRFWQSAPEPEHLGRGARAFPQVQAASKGNPLSEQEILDLIDSLPDNEAGLRWCDALRLMAELGLRPVELLYMSVRKHHATGELIWWCDYRKCAGVGMTKPRRAFALPLINQDGKQVRWNLLERWNAGLLQLPPLGSTQRVSRTTSTYLYKKPKDMSLMDRCPQVLKFSVVSLAFGFERYKWHVT